MIQEFGDATNYTIQGLVVVGGVAANGSSGNDIDIYLLATTEYDSYEDEFLSDLKKEFSLPLDNIGTIYLSHGDRFMPMNLNEDKEPDDLRTYHTSFDVILRNDSPFSLQDIIYQEPL